ncbi:hypothetical protein AOLI_G00122290 [Acnodon oligacanthus]
MPCTVEALLSLFRLFLMKAWTGNTPLLVIIRNMLGGKAAASEWERHCAMQKLRSKQCGDGTICPVDDSH